MSVKDVFVKVDAFQGKLKRHANLIAAVLLSSCVMLAASARLLSPTEQLSYAGSVFYTVMMIPFTFGILALGLPILNRSFVVASTRTGLLLAAMLDTIIRCLYRIPIVLALMWSIKLTVQSSSPWPLVLLGLASLLFGGAAAQLWHDWRNDSVAA